LWVDKRHLLSLLKQIYKVLGSSYTYDMTKKNQSKCENCSKSHDMSYGSGRFCCQRCSRSFATKSKRKIINEKVSKTLSARKRFVKKHCPVCEKIFEVSYGKRKQRTCSKPCSQKWRWHSEKNPQRILNLEKARNNGKKSAASQNNIRRSKNEILFFDMCKKEFRNVLSNTPMFNGWDADVILPDYKIAVLWNGKWHYEKIMEETSLLQIQNRDKIKIKEIKRKNYLPYIIKDMGKHNPLFVQEQFSIFLDYLKTKEKSFECK